MAKRKIEYEFNTSHFWGWYFFGSFILVGPFIYFHKLCRAMNLLCEDYNERPVVEESDSLLDGSGICCGRRKADAGHTEKGGPMMYFKFHTNITDKDYLDYNVFWMTKSPYGKKQIIRFRLFIVACMVLFSFLALLVGGVSGWIGIIPYLLLLILLQFLLRPFFIWVIKGHIKSLKKQGKMAYSPTSEIEFFEDAFTETTPENKFEQLYSSVERVSVVGDKFIYIHVNNIMAYILPVSCFDSTEQYDEFLDFMKTKCQTINIY